MDWIEWFGWKTNPFFIKPLQSDFDELMVKTPVIENEISSWPAYIKENPFTKLVVGKRGIGKSTALRYLVFLCHKNNILAAYVGVNPQIIVRSREPIHEILRQLYRGMLQEFLRISSEVMVEFFEKYKKDFIKWGKFVHLRYDEIEGFIVDPTISPRADLNFMNDLLLGFLDRADKNGIKSLVVLDNLDKLPTSIMTRFLSGVAGQPLFEKLNEKGASVVIAASSEVAEEIWRNENLSYLREHARLSPLSPSQAESLLIKRMKKFCKSEKFTNPFDREVIYEICNLKKGITREILVAAEDACRQAYERRCREISKKIIDLKQPTKSKTEMYYNLISDQNLKNAAERLFSVVDQLTSEDIKECLQYIYEMYNGKYEKIPLKLLEILSKEGIISISRNRYQLDTDVTSLLRKVQENGWEILDFLQWFLRPENIEVVRVQIPTFRVRRLVDRFLKKMSGLKLKRTKVVIRQNRVEVIFQASKWWQSILSHLKNAMQINETISKADWEDLGNDVMCEQVHFLLKNFLLAFSKFIAAIFDTPIEVRTRFKNLESWDFIKATIFSYQRKKKMSFKTYRHIQKIISDYFSMKKGAFLPNEEDVSVMVKLLDEVILEFSREWESALSTNLDLFIVKVEPTESEDLHEALRSRVHELSRRMGYTTILESYRIFRVNGDEYYRLGYFRKPTNTAELDIVNCKVTISKDGKERYEYFICEVKRGKNKATRKDVSCFVRKCEDLIRILSSRIEEVPQVLKPNFLLWFVSYSGFTPEAKKVLSKVKLPRRAQMQLIDIYKLNKLFRQYNLKTYPLYDKYFSKNT